MSARVVGRIVQACAVPGVGRVRVGHDIEWGEYRVQAWDRAGALWAEYHTEDKAEAVHMAGVILGELERATA